MSHSNTVPQSSYYQFDLLSGQPVTSFVYRNAPPSEKKVESPTPQRSPLFFTVGIRPSKTVITTRSSMSFNAPGLYLEKHKEENVKRQQLINLKKGRVADRGFSVTSQRSVERLVDYMVLTSDWKRSYNKETKKYVRYKLGIITLTLPAAQAHDDKFITANLLMPFIENLCKSYYLKRYIWKAEVQKNGNIHYHITVDKFIYSSTIRRLWNNQLNKYGYIDAFYNKFGHRKPPTTEIKSVRKVNKIAAYISKYMSKKSEVREVTGRSWGASRTLTGIKDFKFVANENQIKTVFNIIKKASYGHVDMMFSTVYFARFSDVFSHSPPLMKEAIITHFNNQGLKLFFN